VCFDQHHRSRAERAEPTEDLHQCDPKRPQD
jgi:hypothetical protein